MVALTDIIILLAAIESIDIPKILSQQGGEAVYPLPRIRGFEVHPKLNLATILFAVKSYSIYRGYLILITAV